MIEPSKQQQDIIDEVASGKTMAVLAYAGTGKSTTLRMIAEAYPDKKFLYVVYNKSQQEEAVKKMPLNVEVRTGDSLAWTFVSSVYQDYGRILSDRKRGDDPHYLLKSKDIAQHFGFDRYAVTKSIIGEKGSFDKNYTLTIHQTVKHIQRAIERFCSSEDLEINIDHFDKMFTYPPGVVYDANAMWEDIKNLSGRMKIGFPHIAKLWALKNPDLSTSDKNSSIKYDALMIDEAQDTNPVFGKVYRSQTIQRIYVGDSYQAIYGFRGAGDELIKIKPDMTFPLTNSYRFGARLAGMANTALDKMDAIDEIVGLGDEPEDLFPVDWDVVLCRTNAGVIQAIFKNLEQGREVKIKAAYAAELAQLLDTIAWFWGYIQDKPKLHPDLEGYESKLEIEEAIEEGDESQMVIEVIHLLNVKGYQYLNRVLSELNAKKKKDRIEIITAHRSKGSEWDRVYIWSDFRGPKKNPHTGKDILPPIEELKLGYVAITRAKKHLDVGSLQYLVKKKEEKPYASN
jgi:energy-coupling factor transporter ATP-binding protein EcfA2